MDPAILTVGASTSLKRLIRAAMTAGNDSQFELHTAANSAEAIDVCRGRRFALILIELNGDSSHSRSGIPALKAANPEVPILVLADDPETPGTDSLEREMAKVVLNAIGDAVLGMDTSGRLTYANRVAQQLLGREASLLYGIEFAQACPVYDIETKTTLSNPTALVEGAKQVAQMTRGSVLVRADGAEIPIEYSVSPLYDQLGTLAGAVFVFRDLSESLAMTERMSYVAHHDFLTDLPNRVLLNDRLSKCIGMAERQNRRLSILFLDLDGF